MAPTHNAVLSTALKLPCLNKMHGKRVILASNSPRRREILKTYVRLLVYCRVEGVASDTPRLSKGLDPEVIPSRFQEDLSHSDYPNPYEYPVATATHKVRRSPWAEIWPHQSLSVGDRSIRETGGKYPSHFHDYFLTGADRRARQWSRSDNFWYIFPPNASKPNLTPL